MTKPMPRAWIFNRPPLLDRQNSTAHARDRDAAQQGSPLEARHIHHRPEVPLAGAPSMSVIVSKKAIQTIKERRPCSCAMPTASRRGTVRAGREDDDDIEIVAGLSPSETIAVQNTFTLKAEPEKDEAEHSLD